MAFPYLPLAIALSEFVPLISRWISGEESEKQAREIVEIAQRVTGAKAPPDILDNLRNDPMLVIKLQQAIIESESSLALALLQDRQSARRRDIALQQSGSTNIRADIMVVAAAVGLVSCLVTITIYRQNLPGEAVGIISTIAGIFGSCLKDAYAFEFGSSRGSKQKDSELRKLVGE